MSNIKVYVEWKKPVVFAGELVQCTIVVRNEAEGPGPPTPGSSRAQGRRLVHEDNEKTLPTHEQKRGSSSPPRSLLTNHTVEYPEIRTQRSQHRFATSRVGASDVPDATDSNKASCIEKKHTRSVSVVSLGGAPSLNQRQDGINHLPSSVPPQFRRHWRATSFQGLELDTQAVNSMILSPSIVSSTPSTTTTSTRTAGSIKIRSEESDGHKSERFITNNSEDQPKSVDGTETFQLGEVRRRPAITRPSSIASRDNDHSKALIPMSPNNTPRTSTDLNSPSNNSTETLASEYIGPSVGRTLIRPLIRREPYSIALITNGKRSSEILMMGYACLTGSFVLDESLVNGAPFEEVKRKGAIGWQGSGGLVGIESKKQDSGLLGNLGWNNIGESLGGLLKPAEQSSLRGMKGMGKTKVIPILSTPQTILFIDLSLKPGEAKSYTYSVLLPENIPPSHKGRAIKISYSLIVGIQRQQLKMQQHPVRHVEVPFRVLPSVDSDGEVIKYNLMFPHVQLRKKANAQEPGEQIENGHTGSLEVDAQPVYDPTDFVAYVNELLSRPVQNPSIGLLSPTEPAIMRSLNAGRESRSIKESINNLTSRGHAWAKLGPIRYQIQKNGLHVAVILLSRPAFRLGESVPVMIDFRTAGVNCISVRVYLESLESIDPAIALRAEAATHRATRKVHASCSEFASYGKKLFFATTIPLNGTPDFVTSGITLSWRLRFEFATKVRSISNIAGIGFMEELTNDDRGRTLVAEDEMLCESFEVNIPLRVFGISGRFSEQPTPVGFSI